MKDQTVYLRHILEAIRRSLECPREGREAFLADTRTQDAVIRNLEVLGEATKALSQELRDRNPGIPWSAMARMRDRLIHHYFGVQLDIVWQVVASDLPTLQTQVQAVLASLSPPAPPRAPDQE
jgi:uncharacterized protein with HEPN domain